MPTTTCATFAVHTVMPETEALPTDKLFATLPALLGGPVESLCDYTTTALTGVTGHPLIHAVHEAWCHHFPLVLSPDMIWLTVLHGLALHIKNTPEAARSQWVNFAGQRTLNLERDDLVPNAPENPWAEVITEFADEVHAQLVADCAWLRADFSTTGPRERIAADIALLDALQPYFEYRVYGVCGIPTITLEGTPSDWQRLADKVEHLVGYGLDHWLAHLRPIVQQFVRAANGDVDLDFWRNLYKRLDLYGGYQINGWLVRLFPYLQNWQTGLYTEANPFLREPYQPYPPAPAVPQLNQPEHRFSAGEPTLSPKSLPTGIAAAPFTFTQRNGSEVAMEFVGGFLGVTQDAESLALRPYIGWGVRRRSALDQMLAQLRQHQMTPPVESKVLNANLENLRELGLGNSALPGDFLSFYKTCNGANLFGGVYRVLPLERLNILQPHCQPPNLPRSIGYFSGRSTLRSFEWCRWVELADGGSLALDLAYNWAKPDEPMDEETTRQTMNDREVWFVIHCRPNETEPRQAYRVVAWSVGEFLRLALASVGRRYWEAPEWEPRGDAFTPPRYSGAFPIERFVR